MIQITSLKERGYVKFYITSQHFKGRVKKHIGKGDIEDYQEFKVQLEGDLRSFFLKDKVTKDSVSAFVDDAVKKLKFGTSIFDYVEEFIEKKRNTKNKHTKNPLSRCTINSYLRAIDLFRRMLIEKGKRPIPEVINEQLLNDFMSVRRRYKHNYMVKWSHRHIFTLSADPYITKEGHDIHGEGVMS